MVFQNPGLEALHQFVTKDNPSIEKTMEEQVEKKVEIEEITKDLQDDARLERPKWKGFG